MNVKSPHTIFKVKFVRMEHLNLATSFSGDTTDCSIGNKREEEFDPTILAFFVLGNEQLSNLPSRCSIKNTQMVHRKKHDMVLNLGLGAKGNTFSDQTPTPTQFIRNCEEVGLFQDLQNVNPFEETFKKAVEAVKAGHTSVLDKSFQSNPCDDTLHTPNVFPHITSLPSGNHNTNIVKLEVKHLEDNLPKKGDANNANEKELHPKTALEPSKSNLENINHKRRKVSLCDKYVVKEVQTEQNLVRNENKEETCLKSVLSSNASANDSNQMQVAIKEKIKNNIHNKQMPLLIQLKVPIPKSKSMSRCQKSQKDRFSTFSKNSLKFECSGERSEPSVLDVNKKRNIRKNYSGLSKEKIDILERNRAAATRCREKKKIYVSYLEKLNRELTDSNRKLIHHNSYLKKQVSLLQNELLKHHNCSMSNSKEESITASVTHVDMACKSLEQFEMERKVCENVQNGTESQGNYKTNKERDPAGVVSDNAEKVSSCENKIVSDGGGGGSSSSNINNESFTSFYSKPCSMKSFYEEDRLRKIYIDHSYFNYPYLTNAKKKYANSCVARSKSNPGFSTMNAINQNSIGANDKIVDSPLSQTESVLEVQTQGVTF